jgi:hypothetical protein
MLRAGRIGEPTAGTYADRRKEWHMQRVSEQEPAGNQARIEAHGAGEGPPTPEAVERRAREIAEIAGRDPEQVTQDDRVRASQELHDQALHLSTEDAHSDVLASSNPADMAVETGHRVENTRPMDEQQTAEEEVKEGLREAEHERMLEGQRRKEGGKK